MLKKIIFTGILLSSVTVGLSGLQNQVQAQEKMNNSSLNTMWEERNMSLSEMKYGEIIGPDSLMVDDQTILKDLTLPGSQVSFLIPSNTKESYLHFAIMYGKSGEKGWYFAPTSDYGILLSKDIIQKKGVIDITKDISLFAAPNNDSIFSVQRDEGDLKYGDSTHFMKVEVRLKCNMYEVTIKNISKNDFETPFSGGVWKINTLQMKDFDHMPSSELSILATMGNRVNLYKKVK